MSDELKVPAFARRFVDFVEHRKFVAMLLGVLLLGALASGMPKLRADFTHRGFFFDDDPMLMAFDRFERRFGNDDAIVVAMHSPSGVFDEDSSKLLIELTEKMWLVPEVIRVDSLTNFNWVHADGDELIVEPLVPDDLPLTPELLAERKKVALTHETIPNYLVSADGKTAMVFATIKPGIDAPPNAPVITNAVRELTKELKRSDHEFYISGGPAVSNAFAEASQMDFGRLVPIVMLLTILLLAILLRSILGIFLSLLVVITSVMGSMGLAGHLGIEITNVTATLPQILIAIGVADAVHVLVTMLRRMRLGHERSEAVRYSLLKNFLPTLITSLTTSIGFFAFVSADLKPVNGLGQLAGAGTLLAWLMTYLLLGPLCYLLPFRVKEAKEAAKRSDERAASYANLLIKYRTPVIAGFSVAGIVCFALATQNTVNSDPFKYFREGFDIRVANEFIEDNVGGARGVELAIDAGEEEGIKDPEFLAKVEAFQAWIDKEIPGVSRTVSIVDILKQTNRSLNAGEQAHYKLPPNRQAIGQELFLYTMSLPQGMNINDRVSIKNDAMRVTVLWTISSSKDVTDAIAKIEDKGKEMGLTVNATGKNRLYQSMNGYVVNSFIWSLSIAVVLISIVLIAFFRSARIGLLAMLPNAIPLILGGAVLFVCGQNLDIGTVLVMSVSLGIAVDDTIHVITNYIRLRAEDRSPQAAVREVIAHTSPALVTTSVILVVAFGTFVFATFTPNLWFGILSAIILTIALVTDLTFLPALLMGSKAKA